MECPIVIATLTLLPERKGPLHTGWRALRPHIVIGPHTQRIAGQPLTELYQSVVFLDEFITISPGETREVILGLWAYPDNQYENVIPGATFTLREGPHIAGYGTIIDRA